MDVSDQRAHCRHPCAGCTPRRIGRDRIGGPDGAGRRRCCHSPNPSQLSSARTVLVTVSPAADQVRVWEARTGKCVRKLEEHAGGVYALAALEGGRCISCRV